MNHFLDHPVLTLVNYFFKLRKHFSHPGSEGHEVTLESQLRLSDSQLLFNIEALKIAKRARDLQITTNTSSATTPGSASNKSRKLIKPNFILNKLRKFKSLPNLSVIKSIAMRRIKSRSGKKITFLTLCHLLRINISAL